jgi:hypothetical protein
MHSRYSNSTKEILILFTKHREPPRIYASGIP